jgi:hypothetical protein
MNRWRSRLAALHNAVGQLPSSVQNVQIAQNRPPSPPFEHFEHFEQQARLAERVASTTDAELVAPSPWFERVAPPFGGEPLFEKPFAARCGRVEARGGVFLHFCPECGAWGAYGYGVNLGAGRFGRWYCAAHRPQG